MKEKERKNEWMKVLEKKMKSYRRKMDECQINEDSRRKKNLNELIKVKMEDVNE